MPVEFLYFLLLVGAFVVSAFVLKLPASVSMLVASFITLVVSGNGLNVRHLIEGSFGFLDTILVIVTAMIFMRFVQESGGLDALSFVIIRRFKSLPIILLPMLMLIAMFPGMITGSSSASVLTAGAIVAPVLITMGVPLHKAGAFIAMAGVLGMIAPPVNIPAKIIGSGIDMPFVGFTIPLLLLTIPPAIICAWFFALKYVRKLSWEELAPKLKTEGYQKHGMTLFVPVGVVVLFLILGQIFPAIFGLGLPVVFLLGAASGIFVGNKFNALKAAKQAVNEALPVLGILAGVGMFIQVMTLTGVRGFIVVNALSVNPALLYGTIAVSMPLFGIVSAFGSASVLGTPFSLALLGGDHIIVVSALSMIAGMGDFMPPTALSAIFAAQVIGESRYSRVLKKLVIPALIILLWALMFVIFSREVRSIIS
jgi:TRAP-type C4-dicarboxylate transport system permease large subunit